MMTRIISCTDHIIVKAELDNPGCSHKYRAAKYIIEQAIAKGYVISGETTIIEKTGGNFGFGLLTACSKYGLNIDLAIGLSFSKRKHDLLNFLGVRLIGEDMLAAGMTPKEVVQYHIENQGVLGQKYYYTDQFNNPMGLEAHYKITGSELVFQLHQEGIRDEVIFVGGAGTGASFTGVCLALQKANFRIKAILVEPDGCDMRKGEFKEHRIEGISVGVSAPFLAWELVSEVQTVTLNELLAAKRWFYLQTGIFIGNSSAANIAVARGIRAAKRFEGIPIVTMAYDSGLWYDDLASLSLN